MTLTVGFLEALQSFVEAMCNEAVASHENGCHESSGSGAERQARERAFAELAAAYQRAKHDGMPLVNP